MKQTIYKKDTKGNIRFLTVSSEGIEIVQTSGIVGTDSPVEHRKDAKPKNIGRSNETTAEEQSLKECEAIIVDKLTKGYFHTPEEAREEEIILPMLAKNYFSEEKKIKDDETLIVEAKYDGCFTGSTLIETKEGLLKIKDIVDNKMQVKVKSYNETTNKIEWRPVVNWFNNGVGDSEEFIVLKTGDGMEVTWSKNHKFYTKRGWVTAEDIIIDEDELLMSREAKGFRSVLGNFLGDGTILLDKRHKFSAVFTFSHSITQSEYLKDKEKTIGLDFTKGKRVSGYGSEILYTRALKFNTYNPYTALLFNEDKSKKLLTKPFLDKYFNNLSLAIWIGDDGSLHLNNGAWNTPRLNLSTHAFSDEQLDIFIYFFKTKYKVEPVKVVDNRGKGTVLWFTTKDTLYLLNSLRRTVPKGVEYKFYFEGESGLEEFNEYSKVVKKTKARHQSFVKYDIEVEGNHNYYADGFLVHNCRILIDIDPDKDKVTILTRQGKELTTVPHLYNEALGILAQLQIDGSKRLILDGELYAGTGFTFQECMSLIKKEQPGQDVLQYIVYDIVDENKTFLERKEFITRFFGLDGHGYYPESKRTICAGPWDFANKSKLKYYFEEVIEIGYEGLMVKRLDGMYKINGRSSDLLKYKEFIDLALPIVNVLPSDARPDHAIIVVDFEGEEVRCGMKVSHEERANILLNSEDYIGKIAEIRFFEYTDGGSLRFPVYHGLKY